MLKGPFEANDIVVDPEMTTQTGKLSTLVGKWNNITSSLFGQLYRLIKRGYMGSNFTATTTINDYIWDRFLIPEKFSNPPLFLSEFTGEIHSHETKMRAKYLEHIEKVRKLVPPERLLIWNVKEGWEPLCKFLGRPVPDLPIPHENKTGDLAFNAKYTYGNKFTQVS